MKDEVLAVEGIYLIYFISHMVQMKAQKLNNSWKIIITLYPTWFRWKEIFLIDYFLSIYKLYIPHGSDESRAYVYNLWLQLKLYIPHGSDERRYCILLPALLIPLYPTWFRWKWNENHSCTCSILLLYIPHGSDESAIAYNRTKKELRLYIPHGSDESTITQMFLSRPLPSLYPTWFRWKINTDFQSRS